MWGGQLRSLRKDCDRALTWQRLRCEAEFLFYVPSSSASKLFMEMLKSTGPKREPCQTPLVTEKNFIIWIFSSKMESHCDCIFHGWDISTEGVYTVPKFFKEYSSIIVLQYLVWKMNGRIYLVVYENVYLLVRKIDSMFSIVILALLLTEFYEIPKQIVFFNEIHDHIVSVLAIFGFLLLCLLHILLLLFQYIFV